MLSLLLRRGLVCLAVLLPLIAGAQAPSGSMVPQTTNSTPGIPTFYANSHQVIVEVDVWDMKRKKGDETGIDQTLPPNERALLKRLPPPAQGLTVNDFHVFDNGVEQKINYFKETDFPAVDMTNQWYFFPTTGGTWRLLPLHEDVKSLSASYLIGYAPSALQPSECRSTSIVVEGREVHANRDRYCAPNSSGEHDAGALRGTKLGARMRQFADSPACGSIKVEAQAFTFWSSGVLKLATQTSSPDARATVAPDDYTYVVEVHDAKAPATVQITAAFTPPRGTWYYPCQKDEVLYVLGIVYKANGEVAEQFADSSSCSTVTEFWPKAYKPPGVYMPSMFDGEMDLPPGQYELRIVVSDGSSFGRAEIPLHVSALDPHNLTISDVMVVGVLRKASWVLREAARVSPSPVMPTPLVSKGTQFFPDPDVRPRLAQNSPLYLYFEIYEPAKEKPDTAIYYRVRITDLKTGTAVMNTEPMSAANWILPGNVVIPIGLQIDSEKLKPGSYRLEVQASDSAGRETDWRQTNFAIQ